MYKICAWLLESAGHQWNWQECKNIAFEDDGYLP